MKKRILNFLYRLVILVSIPFAIGEITVLALVAFLKEFKYRARIEYTFIKNHVKYGLDVDDVLRKKFLDSLKK